MANSVKLTLETVERGLRFSAVVPNGLKTVVDSGQGRVAMSPIEMLLVSLAGCCGMDVIEILRKKRQQVTGYEIEVSGERRAEHPRSYTRIDVLHRLRGRDLSAAAVQQAVELAHSKYCSVQGTIDPAVTVVNRFEILPAEVSTHGA